METITHSRDGVTVTIEHEAGTARRLKVEIPAIDFTLTGHHVYDRSGIAMWDHEAPTGRGTCSFNLVFEAIPESAVDPKTGADIPIIYIVAEVLNIHGIVTDPAKGFGTLLRAALLMFADMHKNYGPGLVSNALHLVASEYGYRLEPDDALIAELGECPAYHEQKGAVFDAMMNNPTIDGIFAALGINPADLTREGKDDPK